MTTVAHLGALSSSCPIRNLRTVYTECTLSLFHFFLSFHLPGPPPRHFLVAKWSKKETKRLRCRGPGASTRRSRDHFYATSPPWAPQWPPRCPQTPFWRHFRTTFQPSGASPGQFFHQKTNPLHSKNHKPQHNNETKTKQKNKTISSTSGGSTPARIPLTQTRRQETSRRSRLKAGFQPF